MPSDPTQPLSSPSPRPLDEVAPAPEPQRRQVPRIEAVSFAMLDSACRKQVKVPILVNDDEGERVFVVPVNRLTPRHESWVRLELRQAMPRVVRGDDGKPRYDLDDPQFVARNTAAKARARALALALGAPILAEQFNPADLTALRACDSMSGPPEDLTNRLVAVCQDSFTETILQVMFQAVMPNSLAEEEEALGFF